MTLPALGAIIALGGARAAVALGSGRGARFLVPLAGALLVAAAVFGLIPEIAHEKGWVLTLGLVAAGYGSLALLDYAGFAVCPGCSHGREFAGSLVLATGIHAFIDGWGIVAVSHNGFVSSAIAGAILLHKLPEGLALGAMLQASARSPMRMAILAEAPTVLGGAAGVWATPAGWVNYPLAVVAGSFLFLGSHAMMPRRHGRI